MINRKIIIGTVALCLGGVRGGVASSTYRPPFSLGFQENLQPDPDRAAQQRLIGWRDARRRPDALRTTAEIAAHQAAQRRARERSGSGQSRATLLEAHVHALFQPEVPPQLRSPATDQRRQNPLLTTAEIAAHQAAQRRAAELYGSDGATLLEDTVRALFPQG